MGTAYEHALPIPSQQKRSVYVDAAPVLCLRRLYAASRRDKTDDNDVLFYDMTIVIAGELLVGTLLTFAVVPCFLQYFGRGNGA